jgi:hypothetical protein
VEGRGPAEKRASLEAAAQDEIPQSRGGARQRRTRLMHWSDLLIFGFPVAIFLVWRFTGYNPFVGPMWRRRKELRDELIRRGERPRKDD